MSFDELTSLKKYHGCKKKKTQTSKLWIKNVLISILWLQALLQQQ